MGEVELNYIIYHYDSVSVFALEPPLKYNKIRK